jgi:hypothetical protein
MYCLKTCIWTLLSLQICLTHADWSAGPDNRMRRRSPETKRNPLLMTFHGIGRLVVRFHGSNLADMIGFMESVV